MVEFTQSCNILYQILQTLLFIEIMFHLIGENFNNKGTARVVLLYDLIDTIINKINKFLLFYQVLKLCKFI